MATPCPCYGCTNRTITCHGVCRPYQEWSEDRRKQKIWLDEHRPILSDRAKNAFQKKVVKRLRGYDRPPRTRGD